MREPCAITDAVIDRFWKKVNKSSFCWEWQGMIWPNGYGYMKIVNRPEGAHRISYMIANGSIPEGMFICHKCDNRRCVRPDHLFAGTIRDNLSDARQKGRWRAAQGEDTRAAKLTIPQVLAIREKYIPRVVSIYQLSREYHVCPNQIHRIVKRKDWRFI